MKCEECSGKIEKKEVPYEYHGVPLGLFEAEVCVKCGVTLFSMKEARRIEEKAKQKGVWGLMARTKVGMSGNSLEVRIDKRIANFLGLKKGKEVTLHPEGKDKLVIEI